MQKTYLVSMLAVCLLLPYPQTAAQTEEEGGIWNTLKNFARLVQQAGDSAAAALTCLKENGRSISAPDTNSDGLLDQRELAEALGERTSVEDRDVIVALADEDGDGMLSKREVENMFL